MTFKKQEAIQKIPKIDRHSPQCLVGAVESLAYYYFGIRDLSKIFGRHGFNLVMPPGEMKLRSNQVELDLYFTRVPWVGESLWDCVNDIYGFRPVPYLFEDYRDYLAFCTESGERNEPFIAEVSVYFIKARREYRKIHLPHVVIMNGYDPELRKASVVEQMVGCMELEEEEIEGNFRYHLETLGKAPAIYRLRPSGREERPLYQDEIQRQIASNIGNLLSDSENLGLKALGRFQKELRGFLHSESFQGKPFTIPGHWVFAHERNAARKWLASLTHCIRGPAGESFLHAFDQHLSGLFQKWLRIDFTMEKCLFTGVGENLQVLPKNLEQIIPDEAKAAKMWGELAKMVE